MRLASARARTTPPMSGDTTTMLSDLVLPQVAQQDRRAVNVVERNREESLDLVGMQIDRQHAVDAGRRDHAGDERAVIGTRAARGRRSCRA